MYTVRLGRGIVRPSSEYRRSTIGSNLHDSPIRSFLEMLKLGPVFYKNCVARYPGAKYLFIIEIRLEIFLVMKWLRGGQGPLPFLQFAYSRVGALSAK
jgi:hypothetical protein